MKLKNTKKTWEIAKTICLIGVTFWILETFYFIIKHGWHSEAINEHEKTCDEIVLLLFNISTILFIIVLLNVVDYLLSYEKK